MAELSSAHFLRQLLFQEVFFAAIAAIFLTVALSRGFFRLPFIPNPFTTSIKQLLLAFFVYFCTTLVLSYLIAFIVGLFISNHQTEIHANVLYIGWVNLFLQAISLGAILFFTSFFFPGVLRKIFLPLDVEQRQWSKAIGMGFLGCIIALPLVHFVSNSFDVLMYLIYKVQHLPDQQAVRFLKAAMESPFSFVLALISIIILAPLLEEVLFRGFLQNFLKKYLGVIGSICITAFIFALFHYSPVQRLGNFSVVGSLFVLAFFLGFIYERQQNLISSIVLHATFNFISIISIFLFKDI